MKMTETQLVAACLEMLSVYRIFGWRNNSGAFKTESGGFYRFGAKGSPDILAICNGKFIGIECKVGHNKLSPAQVDFQRRVEAAGGNYWLVYSLDDLEKYVNPMVRQRR